MSGTLGTVLATLAWFNFALLMIGALIGGLSQDGGSGESAGLALCVTGLGSIVLLALIWFGIWLGGL